MMPARPEERIGESIERTRDIPRVARREASVHPGLADGVVLLQQFTEVPQDLCVAAVARRVYNAVAFIFDDDGESWSSERVALA